MGEVYKAQGKYAEAEYNLEYAFHIKFQLVGLRQDLTIKTAHSLAEVYSARGKYEKSELLFTRIIKELEPWPRERLMLDAVRLSYQRMLLKKK